MSGGLVSSTRPHLPTVSLAGFLQLSALVELQREVGRRRTTEVNHIEVDKTHHESSARPITMDEATIVAGECKLRLTRRTGLGSKRDWMSCIMCPQFMSELLP